MKTRAQRIDLVQNVVAHVLADSVDPQFSGTFTTPESLLPVIISNIKIQAFGYGIPEKHHQQMIQDGIKFYDRHLKVVVAHIFAMKRNSR